ncbi:protein artemis [Nephila pilipes]|uniref:Protein artemis n=1 Tax=Nephila pilipes TaxID=299642 RepID=A0A8X6NFN8_NEPPI|nr:protein artemis [Nephila pilipes]
MSTFDGVIKEYPLISIDNFLKKCKNFESTVFFLSHCHTDHMHGLNHPGFFQLLESRCFSKVYMSDVSHHILKNDDAFSHLNKYWVTIPLEQPTIIPVPNKDGEVHTRIVVTLLTAGHCPGSVMIYIEGENGKVLYTGDFRLPVGDSARLINLHDEQGRLKSLDALYVDTTFCKKNYMYFPTREQGLEAVESLVIPWLAEGPDHIISFICPAKYNYEFIFVELFKKIGEKVHVSEERLRQYKGIKVIEEAVTCIATESRIHACYINKNGLKAIFVHEMPCGYKTEDGKPVKVRYIKPCAMSFTNLDPGDDVYVYEERNQMYKVCFSTHSSLSEIRDLAQYLKPKNIYPNVVQKQTVEEIIDLINAASPRDTNSSDLNSTSSPLGILKRPLPNDKSHASSSNSLPFYDDYYKINQKNQPLDFPSVKSCPMMEAEGTNAEPEIGNLNSPDISPVKWLCPFLSSDDENCDPNSSYSSSKDRSDSETTYGTSEEQECKNISIKSAEKSVLLDDLHSNKEISESLVDGKAKGFVNKSVDEVSKKSTCLHFEASTSVNAKSSTVNYCVECNNFAKKSALCQILNADPNEMKYADCVATFKMQALNVTTNKYFHNISKNELKLEDEKMRFVKYIGGYCTNNTLNKSKSTMLKSVSVDSSNVDVEIESSKNDNVQKDFNNFYESSVTNQSQCNVKLSDVPEKEQVDSSPDVEVVFTLVNSKNTLDYSNLTGRKNKDFINDDQMKNRKFSFPHNSTFDLFDVEKNKSFSSNEKSLTSENSPIQSCNKIIKTSKNSFYQTKQNSSPEFCSFISKPPNFERNCDNNIKKDFVSNESSFLKCVPENLYNKSTEDYKFIKKLSNTFTSKAYSFSQKLLDISAPKSERKSVINKQKLLKNSIVSKRSSEGSDRNNKYCKEVELIDLSSDDSDNPLNLKYDKLSSDLITNNNSQKKESHCDVIDSSSDVEVLDSSPSLLFPTKFRREFVDSTQHSSSKKRNHTEEGEFSFPKSPKLNEDNSPDIFEGNNDVESTPDDL